MPSFQLIKEATVDFKQRKEHHCLLVKLMRRTRKNRKPLEAELQEKVMRPITADSALVY
jgi:hypothetical protein